jgi:hypothetical protein
MKLYQIKDIVRDHFSRTAFPTVMLDEALAGGRRMIEGEGNWWWMRATATPSLVIAQQSYSILTSTSNGFNKPNFKDVRAAAVKRSTDTEWTRVDVGEMPLEEAEQNYATDETGETELMIVDNETAILFPIPDAAYNFKMWNYEWTANPALNTHTATDALIDRFPDALIYAALIWGYEMELKDFQGAAYWRQLLGGQPFGRGGEISKIRNLNLKRERQDQITLVPMTGPFQRRRQLRTNRNIWI